MEPLLYVLDNYYLAQNVKNAETARVTFIFLTWENGCRHVKLGRRSEEVTTVASYEVCRMEAVVIDDR